MTEHSPHQLNLMIALYTGFPKENLKDKWTRATDFHEYALAYDLMTEEHKPTPRLKAFVDHLCRQPLPEIQWVFKNTEIE